MKLEDVYDGFEKRIDALDSLLVSNDEAWLNEDGTEHARIDDKSVFLDIEDDRIRKEVFTRSILRAIRKNNWHTDVIRSVEDVMTDNDNCKIMVFLDGESSVFPNYRIYLKEDGIRRDMIAREMDEVMRSLWKTDHEFFMDVVRDVLSRVLGYDEFQGRFLKYFDDNVFGIRFSEVMGDSEALKMVKDMVFSAVVDKDRQFCDD